MKNKDLLGLKNLSSDDINYILETASKMKAMLINKEKKQPLLAGKSVITLFYENSTRTRMSFEAAAKNLGGSTSAITAAVSSVSKGETLVDTAKNLDALLPDVIVIRHPVAGAPEILAKNVSASVVNGGDGMNEHPTQALLDIFTMKERFSHIKGLKVALCGDIKFSRVARSNIWALSKLGAFVTVCAPFTLIPNGIEELGCKVETSPEKAIAGADVVMGLRIQAERQQGGMFPSSAEYASFFGINEKRMKLAKKTALVMHPGPSNRGVELTSDVMDSGQSVVLDQVTNGVAVRMAVLKILTENRGAI